MRCENTPSRPRQRTARNRNTGRENDTHEIPGRQGHSFLTPECFCGAMSATECQATFECALHGSKITNRLPTGCPLRAESWCSEIQRRTDSAWQSAEQDNPSPFLQSLDELDVCGRCIPNALRSRPIQLIRHRMMSLEPVPSHSRQRQPARPQPRVKVPHRVLRSLKRGARCAG